MSGNRFYTRPIRIIHEAIEKFELNLSGLIVFTEAGAGNYLFTPFIAALAGAREVVAVIEDSRYARATEVQEEVSRLAKITKTAIRITNSKTPESVSHADIVTNLGHVRPIDENLISIMKTTAVVPLMFETWEFRNTDLDLGACRKKGICVLGTNEEDSRLKIFEYLGHLCAKILFENDIEVFQSKIIVIGGGKFGNNISAALQRMGAVVFQFATRGIINIKNIKNADVIITADHEADELLIGEKAIIPAEELGLYCSDTLILNLAGNIDREALDRYEIHYLPEIKEKGHMGFTLSQLGPKPVIDLHTAGLKVGEIMARYRQRGFSPQDTLREALKNPLCQDF